MSKQTLYILGILATILLGAILYPKLCCKDCCEKPTKDNVPAVTDNSTKGDYNIFHLKGNDFEYSCHENFQFLSNGFNTIEPVNDSISNGIRLLKTYFDRNPDEKLLITGYALNSEKNSSAFPDLGLARANDVKNYFVSKGFATDRFETHGELREAWKTSNDTVLGTIAFNIKHFEKETAPTEDWNAIKEKINTNPLILYFGSNQSEIDLTPEERQKIADLSNYLDNVPNAKISCIGHTDASGNRNKNNQLAKNRADFAKKYLSENGISPEKIETSSKGAAEPIADNTTAEGKAKNRRTVITLK